MQKRREGKHQEKSIREKEAWARIREYPCVSFFFLLLLELESIPILRADLVAVPGSDRLTRSSRPLKPSACEVSTSSSGRGDCGPANPPPPPPRFFSAAYMASYIRCEMEGPEQHVLYTGFVPRYFHTPFSTRQKSSADFPFFVSPKSEKHAFSTFGLQQKPYLFHIFCRGRGVLERDPLN